LISRIDYYRAALLGVVVATFFLSMFYVITRDDVKEPQKPQSNIEVVGTYKECEIIQYTNPRLANNHYLLYCGDQK
jgi:hypothetical protein